VSQKQPGRPRQVDLDRRLVETTLRLVREAGPAAVTVDRVAAESGVAKTSIYRRHANRAELLTAALESAVGPPVAPVEGSVAGKIRLALQQLWGQMADVLGPGGLAAIVGDTDPEFTALFRAALRPFEQALLDRIREDRETGRLRSGVDPDALVSLMLGAYLGELVRRGAVSEDWLDRSLELIWRAVVATR
jgi:AcrR family transcriptional regulator